MHFRIYGKKSCPWCVKAIKLLDENMLDYTYVDLTDPANILHLDRMKALGAKTVPQCFYFREYSDTPDKELMIGGYESLEMFIKTNDLAKGE